MAPIYINSQILPLIKHPYQGSELQNWPGHNKILDAFRQGGEFGRRSVIRTSFDPDHFVVIDSPRPDVRRKSVEALVYQTMAAEWVGVEVINIHADRAYGDKSANLKRVVSAIRALPGNGHLIGAGRPQARKLKRSFLFGTLSTAA